MMARMRLPLFLATLVLSAGPYLASASFQDGEDKKDAVEKPKDKDAKPKEEKPKEEKPKEVKSDLEGSWEVTKAEENGGAVPLVKAKFTFKGDKLTVLVEKETIPYTFKLDPAKMPKTIDLDEDLVKDKKETSLGIYEVTGDVLKLCVAEAELKERPTEFKSAKKKVIYLELKKDKS